MEGLREVGHTLRFFLIFNPNSVRHICILEQHFCTFVFFRITRIYMKHSYTGSRRLKILIYESVTAFGRSMRVHLHQQKLFYWARAPADNSKKFHIF